MNTAINTIHKKLSSTATLYLNQPDLIYYEKQLDLCKQNGARMKLVLNYRKNNYTLRYIASKIGITQERVRQIEHKAIAIIKANKRWQTEEETDQTIVFPKYIKVRAKRKPNKPKMQPYDEMIQDKVKQYKQSTDDAFKVLDIIRDDDPISFHKEMCKIVPGLKLTITKLEY